MATLQTRRREGQKHAAVDKAVSESASGGANDSSPSLQGGPGCTTTANVTDTQASGNMEEEQIHFLNKILLLQNCKQGRFWHRTHVNE